MKDRRRFEEIELSEGPADAAPVEFMRDCPACGHPNSMDAVTCEACGVVIAKARPERKLQTRNMGNARVTPEAARAPFGRLLGVLVGLAVIGFAVWFFLLRTTYLVVGAPVGQGEKTVVLLHGFGAPGDALATRARQLSARLPAVTWVLPAGPHAARTGRGWVVGPGENQARESAKESRAAISGLLSDLEAAGVAPDALYLGGYSQGGQVALDYALSPDARPIHGLVLLSGGLPTWPGAYTPGGEGELPGGVSVFLAHGEKDTTVGIEQAARIRALLSEAGVSVRFHTAPGGHAVDDGTVDALVEWLSP